MTTEEIPAAPLPPSDQPSPAVLPEQVPLEASLRGKAYAVTGGSSGIGSSVVLALAAAGASVSFCGRDPERLARVAATAAALATTPDAVLATAVDVTDETAVDAWVQASVDRFGRLDGAVNCAAREAPHFRPVGNMDSETWHSVLTTNLTGAFYCLRAELRHLTAGAVVVNVASIAGIVGFETNGAYAAAKHGVLGLTKSAAKEYGPRGIRINAVSPGLTRTAMMDKAVATLEADGMTELALPELVSQIIQKRVSEAYEQARPILFMLSDYSSFVCGQNLSVDGGWVV